ncbi:MAG: HAMP domain-containing histidine kinase [Bacteroidia bacterium]
MRNLLIILLLIVGSTYDSIGQSDSVFVEKQYDLAYKLLVTNPDSAIIICNEGLTKSSGLPFLNGHLYRTKGIAYQILRDYGAAEESLLKAQKALCNIDAESCSKATVSLAIVQANLNKLNDAITSFNSAILKATEIENDYLIAFCNMEISRMFYPLNEFGKALHFAGLAHDYAVKCNNEFIQYDALTNIGISWMALDSSRAENFLKQAYELSLKSGDSVQLHISKSNLANYWATLNDYEKIIKTYKSSARFFKSKGLDQYLAPDLINLGSAQIHTHEYDKGVKNIITGIELSRKNKQLNFVVNGYKSLAIFYKKNGDSISYFSSMNQKLRTLNKLISLKKGIYKAGMLYEHEKILIDKENELLEKEKLLSEEKLDKQNTIIIGAIFIVGLLIVLFIFQFKKSNVIEAQSVELGKLSKSKDQIISILSHDLRSPLAQIVGLEQALLDYDEDPARIREIQEKLLKKSKLSLEMVEGILIWAKYHLEEKVEKDSVNLLPLLEQLKEYFSDQLNNKGLIITTELSIDVLEVNQSIFTIIIRNLISNAIKYSYNNSTIKIQVKKLNGLTLVDISDSGSGFPESVLKTLNTKEKFYYSSSKGTLGEKGIGIGLFLCKELAENINAEIKVAASTKSGSTVRIQFA